MSVEMVRVCVRSVMGVQGILFFSKPLCGELTKPSSVRKWRSLDSIDLFRGPMAIVSNGFGEGEN